VVGKLKPLDKIRVVKDGVEYEFEVAEEGGYVVSVPAYSSCVSQGAGPAASIGEGCKAPRHREKQRTP